MTFEDYSAYHKYYLEDNINCYKIYNDRLTRRVYLHNMYRGPYRVELLGFCKTDHIETTMKFDGEKSMYEYD